MSHASGLPGPHQRIQVDHPRDRFTTKLFDALWDTYRRRVSYVQMYEQVLRAHGGTFVNDHIAFRTFATQSPTTGIHGLGRLFEALGYRAAGTYTFPDKHLTAVHFQHDHPSFPKLFISELQLWRLDDEPRDIVLRAVRDHRHPLPDSLLATLYQFKVTSDQEDALLNELVNWFQELPWSLPREEEVVSLNRSTQYGAWVLVHGYNVNHFTSLINSHGVETLDDIEKTARALRQAGVPMKAEIEGDVDSPLRQTATEAVTMQVPVLQQGQPSSIPWTYAYFELAQRDWSVDPKTGQRYRFEGFLGSQATQLFEMTRLSHGS